MKQWRLIIDVALCENCGNCQLAAKDEHVGNDFPGYSAPHPAQGAGVIRIERAARGAGSHVDVAYVPKMCNHCADAPCLKAAPEAVARRADGIVVIDPVKAKGRMDIVEACPYGAVIWNEELALPQAWIFDAHLLDQGWNEPRCAQACPTGAMAALRLDDEEWRARAAADGLSSIRPELETRPSVLYRHLSRATHSFIAGSVFAVRDGVKDCVEGAVVSLRASGKEIAFAATDAFGDFRFDGLEPMSGPYEVAVRHDRGRATVAVPQSRESVALADIELTPPG